MASTIRKIMLITACCASSLSYAQTAPMQAKIIGSGSPDYNPERVSAGVLITQGETQILVDMGDGVLRNLNKDNIEPRKMDALLFTHHHLDHNADFSPIFIQSMLGRDDLLIAGPTQTEELVDNNLSIYKQDLEYRLGKSNRQLDNRIAHLSVNDLKSGDSFKIDDIKITTLSVPHTIETLAYRFDYQEQSIVITGDLNSGPGVADFAKNANCMIMDSGGMVMEGNIRNRPHRQADNQMNHRRGDKTQS